MVGGIQLATQLNQSMEVLIDKKSVTAVSSYTCPVWAKNKFRKILIEFRGTHTGGYFQLQMNADATAANYWDIAMNNAGSAGAPGSDSAIGVNGYARVGIGGVSDNNDFVKVEFDPRTNGFVREGLATAISISPVSGAASSFLRQTGFGWLDKTTDVTFFTLSITTGGFTMTGEIRVTGILNS